MDHVDCIVVGAGVIGLAVTRALARAGREVLVLEANARIGAETSSRNNEVIHAGFLYPAGSLKAQLCRPGHHALYRYCATHGIEHRGIGKLMIATSATELDLLRGFADAARLHGVDDLAWLDRRQARAVEPQLHCLAALHSPSTGILDAHGLMLALLGDLEAAGAIVAYRTRVKGGTHAGDRIVLDTAGPDGEMMPLSCRTLVNAAGLGARDIAVSFGGDMIPEIMLAKGSFFGYSGARPFDRLIVPVGDTLSGGGAFTVDVGGQGKFGPDFEHVNRIDYTVDGDRAATFVTSIRRFFPDVDPTRLTPSYSGIRPRVRTPGGGQSDWIVLGPAAHRMRGVFHLLGFDTPGLTGCLAVADHVAAEATAEMEGSCRTVASAE